MPALRLTRKDHEYFAIASERVIIDIVFFQFIYTAVDFLILFVAMADY